MLVFKNVSFAYKQADEREQLQNINLTIKNGEVVLLCGESGCGKTTLTRLVNGLIPHYYEGELSGEVTLHGKKISAAPLYETAARVGSVFQNPRSQFFNVDTTSELAFGCENLGMAESEILRRMDKTIADFNIASLMDRSIFALSGGEKQKIACASVSVMGPEVYVMDEPSSNLDIAAIHDLKQVIVGWKAKGKTVIIAEHRLYYLMDIVDRVIYMKQGKIVFDMPQADFRKIELSAVNGLGLRSLSIMGLENKVEPNHSSKKMYIEDFSFSYDKQQSLAIPALELPRNEVIGILGYNGAGKTTFARCLCGLEKSAKGVLRYNGGEYNAKQRLKLCYMVMQDVNHQLFTESVLDEILLSMEDEDIPTAGRILESMNLLDKKELHPMSLSGGEKQRVAIGSAVASGKEIIVFDEPTSGLDYRHMLKVSESLKQLQKEGKSIFVISHDPELICQCCTYFIFMENGKILCDSPMKGTGLNALAEFFPL